MDTELISVKSIEEKQKILLYIFREFHNICEENNLVYNSFGGTMLGIVRHQGFIPWDDDIDVTMPRKDYNKFLEIIKTKKESGFVVHCSMDDNYIYPYAKFGLRGTKQIENIVRHDYNMLTINIDIFPVDGYPSDESEIDLYNSYENSIILCTYKQSFSQLLIHPRLLLRTIKSRIRGYRFFVEKQIELFSKNAVEDNDYLILQGAGWGRKGKLEKKMYYNRELYNFENIQVYGIKDYDAHMKNLYGDYMTLPPEEKRVSPHNNTAFCSKEIFDKIIKTID